MFVKLRHQSQAVFSNHPGRFVAVFMIFKTMVDRDSGHPNIYTGLQWIAFRIEPQNGAMLCHSVLQQDYVNVVVKRFFVLKRWFLPFQLAGQQKDLEKFGESANLRKNGPLATNTWPRKNREPHCRPDGYKVEE
jgi:hypothetical protein